MHVLAFEATPTWFAGGQERSLFDVLAGLAARGVKVSLAYEREGELLREYERFCLGYHRIPSRVVRRRPSALARFALDLACTGRLVRRSRVDLLYANQYFDLPFAAALGALTGRPVVCHLRLACPHYLSRQYRWGLQRCARLIANSAFTRASYAAAGIDPGRIVVVHNGVDPSAFAPTTPRPSAASGRELLFLGRIAEQKGLDVLIEALHRVRARRSDVRLRVHGRLNDPSAPADYLDRLRARVRELDLTGHVDFLPHVADPSRALATADLVVLPAKAAETFGRVLIEAMAAGVPVVASSVGGIPEVLGPEFATHLVAPGDPDALARRILELVDWRDRCPELGRRVREHVLEKFDLDRVVDQIATILREVVEDRPPPRGW